MEENKPKPIPVQTRVLPWNKNKLAGLKKPSPIKQVQFHGSRHRG
jgi:hypothetical protein